MARGDKRWHIQFLNTKNFLHAISWKETQIVFEIFEIK